MTVSRSLTWPPTNVARRLISDSVNGSYRWWRAPSKEDAQAVRIDTHHYAVHTLKCCVSN